MLGVPINVLEQILRDKNIVVYSCYIPYITCKKEHNDIANNRAREAMTEVVIKMAHVIGKSNPSDILIITFDHQN